MSRGPQGEEDSGKSPAKESSNDSAGKSPTGVRRRNRPDKTAPAEVSSSAEASSSSKAAPKTASSTSSFGVPVTTTAAPTTSSRAFSSVLSAQQLFGCLLVFRLLNAAVLRTAFVPDEQWQSLEPASRLIFGHGHLTWEWAPCLGLRGWLHPLLFAFFYGILEQVENVLGAVFGPPKGGGGTSGGSVLTGWTVAYGPRFVQAVFAAATDYLIFIVARCMFVVEDQRRAVGEKKSVAVVARGELKAWIALFLSLTSWFHSFALVRTLSSCIELFLTISGVCFVEASGLGNLVLVGILQGRTMGVAVCRKRNTNKKGVRTSRSHLVTDTIVSCRERRFSSCLPMLFIAGLRAGPDQLFFGRSSSSSREYFTITDVLLSSIYLNCQVP